MSSRCATWHPGRGPPAGAAKKAPAAKAAVQAEEKPKEPKAPEAAKVAEPKDAYRTALAPYPEACHKAGVECQYEGGRSANVSEKVSFLVEKTDKGVRVMVKGQPKTEEVIPLAPLKESINKAAYGYTDKHVGPKEEVGNGSGCVRVPETLLWNAVALRCHTTVQSRR